MILTHRIKSISVGGNTSTCMGVLDWSKKNNQIKYYENSIYTAKAIS